MSDTHKYLLNIPSDLFNDVKLGSQVEYCSMRSYILRAIEDKNNAIRDQIDTLKEKGE